jgi:phospholipase/carboxylesterase
VATHLDRRSGLALAVGALISASAIGIAIRDSSPAYRGDDATAAAVVTHVPERWPPMAGDLDLELRATALRRIAESAIDDAGMDASETDAGPPIPLPEGELEGIQVRRGFHEGIHYLEVILGEASFDDALPIVFVFHGRGGSAQLPGGPFLGLSHPVRVIVPQAPERLGTGWMWLPVSVGSGLVDRLSASLFQITSRIAHLIRTIVAERPTKGRPIVTGFSQGGLIAYTLALHHDDVVGHAFPLAGWLPPPLEPLYKRDDLRYPAIRSMHGTDDPVIPIGPTRELVARLRARGFDVELHEFAGVGHEMSAEMNALFHRWLEAALCEVLGLADCPGAEAPPEPVLADGGPPSPAEPGADGGAPDESP